MSKAGSVDSSKKWYVDVIINPIFEQKRRVALVFASLIVLALSQSFFLILVGPFLKSLFLTKNESSGIILGDLFPDPMVELIPFLSSIHLKAEMLVIYVPMSMFCAVLIKGLASYCFQLNQQALGLWVSKRFRDFLFSNILKLPYPELKKKPAGRWMSILMNDVHFLQNRISDISIAFMRDTILILSCVVVLLILHPGLGGMIILISPFLIWVLGYFGKKIALYAQKWQHDLAVLSGCFLDIRERFEFIKSQSGEKTEINRFQDINKTYYQYVKKSFLIRSSLAPSLEFVGFVIFATSIFIIGNGWLGQSFGGAELIQFFAALGLILRPLKNVGEQFTRYKETLGALTESIGTIRYINERLKVSTFVASHFQFSEIFIERATVCLEKDKIFTWEDVSLVPNTLTAIIGPSASGKSTFMHQLAGLQPSVEWSGSQSWGDVVNHSNLVSQSPFLFKGTLRQNLIYGCDEKQHIDGEEIWQTLDHVGLLKEIKSLPGELDFNYDPLHSQLSGGQIQRLVIARAMLRKKNLWLFDEAVSAVDAESEKEIINSLNLLKKIGICILFVTHRIQHLSKFDQIWFVENGKICFKGDHQELEMNESYRHYCRDSES